MTGLGSEPIVNGASPPAGTKVGAANLDAMGQSHHPKSAADCVTLLHAVLSCLDDVPPDRSGAEDNVLSLAAAHVQQAIELIQSVGDPEA